MNKSQLAQIPRILVTAGIPPGFGKYPNSSCHIPYDISDICCASLIHCSPQVATTTVLCCSFKTLVERLGSRHTTAVPSHSTAPMLQTTGLVMTSVPTGICSCYLLAQGTRGGKPLGSLCARYTLPLETPPTENKGNKDDISSREDERW